MIALPQAFEHSPFLFIYRWNVNLHVLEHYGNDALPDKVAVKKLHRVKSSVRSVHTVVSKNKTLLPNRNLVQYNFDLVNMHLVKILKNIINFFCLIINLLALAKNSLWFSK